MKNKILVTGGNGFIGSHTVVELISAGFEVVIIDNLSNSHEWINGNISEIVAKKPPLHRIDLCDAMAVDKFFAENTDISGIIHFAADSDVGESVKNPNKYYYNNLMSLINVLNSMKKYGVQNIVFSSSCTVYGEPEQVPISEDAEIVKAESPYGNTKQICEEMITDNTKVYDIKAVALRYFNPVGAHDTALIGEFPLSAPKKLMPVITQTAVGKNEKLFVHGNDFPTKDGTPVRDYFHVMDLARAHVLAVEYMLKGRNKDKFSVFNLGSEKGYTVLEVIKEFERANGVKLNYEVGPRRPGDVITGICRFIKGF
jgi:UDP-glucose 4-epimerase